MGISCTLFVCVGGDLSVNRLMIDLLTDEPEEADDALGDSFDGESHAFDPKRVLAGVSGGLEEVVQVDASLQ